MTEERINTILDKLLFLHFDITKLSAGLSSEEITWLCFTVKSIFLEQPILLELRPPLVVCGDIHGEFHDLLRLFKLGGVPPSSNYVFLGNYVDFGIYSIETISLLFCYKILYPNNFFLLRGNHECSYINRLYGFYDDCIRLYSQTIWRTFSEVFDCLPIAAIIDDKIFCVHGGLSPNLESLDDIKNLPRPMEVPEEGLLHDLLWANPDNSIDTWAEDDESLYFGAEPVDKFIEKFDFDLVVRGNEATVNGYEFPFFPTQTCVTVFSAPCFKGEFDNKGSILKVDENIFCTFSILEPVHYPTDQETKSSTTAESQDENNQPKTEGGSEKDGNSSKKSKHHKSKADEDNEQDKKSHSKSKKHRSKSHDDESQQRINELEKKLKDAEDVINESKKTISDLETQLKEKGKIPQSPCPSYNPFEEEMKEDKSENYFIGEEDAKFFQVVKKISEGATAITYKVIDTRTEAVLCKKTLKVQEESTAFQNAKNAYKEFEALCMIKHPGICRAIGMNIAEPIDGSVNEDDDDKETATTISIYLEFLCKSLKEIIDKKLVDNTLKVRIVIEIVHAINYIHKHGMIHRDIKIENIMLNSCFEAKIVDFGLVRIDECFSGKDFVTTSMTKGIGTLAYMSPEMASEEDYDNKTDVYSFGIVLFYIFTGKLPAYNMKDKMLGKMIPLPKASSAISQFCIDLISKCTNIKPDGRPSFQEILEDIRDHSYGLASEIDKLLIKRRDDELSFYETIKT